MDRTRHFETRAVHSGEHRAGAKDDVEGAFYPISTPIYASTTFSHVLRDRSSSTTTAGSSP